MPEASTDIPPKTRRTLRIIPLAVAFVAVLGAAVFAWSHLATKGPGEHKDLTAAQIAQGESPKYRDQYGPEDYVEPNRK